MENKLRIAFCFSGQARTFDSTYDYFRINLFEQAVKQGFEYDIFCAVEDDDDLDKIYIMNPTIVEKVKSSEVQKIIDKKYGDFIKDIFDKKFFFADKNNKKLEGLLHQLYKIKKVNEIKNKYSFQKKVNYNIVVRLRFDLIFLRKLDFKEIYETIEKEKSIILNSTLDEKYSLVQIVDMFAFGTNENMNIYSNLFDDFKKIFQLKISLGKKGFLFLLKQIKKLLFIIEEKNVKIISNIIGFFKIGLFIIINYLFVRVYTFERIFYEHLIKNNIKLHRTFISNILMRNTHYSSIAMFQKSKFEI